MLTSKISFPKINLKAAKATAENTFKKGVAFAKEAPTKFVGIAQDTVQFVKKNPKQAGVYALAGVGVLAILNGVKNAAKNTIEKIQAKKYE